MTQTHHGRAGGGRGERIRITHGDALRMHAAYQTGATIEAVASTHGWSKSAVSKAFHAWRLPVRNRGTQRKQAFDVLRVLPPVTFKRFCGQCERKVSAVEAAGCGDQFCKGAGR